MTSGHGTAQEEEGLARYLIDQLVARASGSAYSECRRNYPRDVYFLGNLRSDDSNQTSEDVEPHLPELLNKLAPVAFGAEFKILPAENAAVVVTLRWASYYRVFPTFAEQLEHQRGVSASSSGLAHQIATAPVDQEDDDQETDSDDVSEELDRDQEFGSLSEAPDDQEVTSVQGGSQTDVLMIKFRKIPCSAQEKVSLSQSNGDWSFDIEELVAAIDAETARARDVVESDPEAIRYLEDEFEQVRIPDSVLQSAEAYDEFRGTISKSILPTWRWELRFEAKVDANDVNQLLVSIKFINRSARQLSAEGRENPLIESFLFETSAEFVFENCSTVPFRIELAPEGFRYDRNLAARPFNCSVFQTGPETYLTSHTPDFIQDRLQTRQQPSAPFEDLAADPIPVLSAILKSMRDYCGEWDSARAEYEKADTNWSNLHGSEYDADYSLFREEIDRFEAGMNLIDRDQDVRLAFQLTNETFKESGSHTQKTDWRLFQIVFLVSQIPGIASLADTPGSTAADLERVDIIYFPTGGGKTEAYLGVLAFHAFFDRLRGKSAGVTAWTRFPLRLLTIQQMQRVADVICVADLVRRRHPDPRLSGTGVAGFGVGYFVGKSSTPNAITDPTNYRYANGEDNATWTQANDARARQNWKRLIHCPTCWTSTVEVDFDSSAVRVIHRCTNESCGFPGGRIPIYVVDNEIFRYLPTVLVGTIDKLAGIGNQKKMIQVFGDIDGFCRTHGFFKGRCCQKECRSDDVNSHIPAGLSGPTIFVQDELHLLKEGLGTFDGHYETFVQELLRTLATDSKIKVIASSATIEDFERQVEHLYGTDPQFAKIFPGPGPNAASSFYANTLDYAQRIYVGLIPHNKTILNAILELLQYYHSILQELIKLPSGSNNPYGGNIAPGSKEWLLLLDLYVTSLTYFLSSRDLHSTRTDLDGHVSPELERVGNSPLRIFELTGSTTTDEVATSLEFLDTQKAGQEHASSVLATNMVSHGVDIDRFNAMFMYGMPRQNAEYIQASSRVGRAHVGIVFVCHHPARERDQSHYGNFVKFHEFLGQLVEPVAINRWATFSINRTLPGLFMATLLQLIANRDPGNAGKYYRTDYVRQQISSGNLKAADFVPILEQAYGVNSSNDPARSAFRNAIQLSVQQFLDQIVGASSAKGFVSETLIPRPMLSLRDVDEPIPISLDRAGSDWANQSIRS